MIHVLNIFYCIFIKTDDSSLKDILDRYFRYKDCFISAFWLFLDELGWYFIPGLILLKLSHLMHTLPKTSGTFFYVSLMKFSPCAKFLRQFSQQQNAKIGLYLIGIKACHAFLHISSKSCPKLYSVTTVDPGYNEFPHDWQNRFSI